MPLKSSEIAKMPFAIFKAKSDSKNNTINFYSIVTILIRFSSVSLALSSPFILTRLMQYLSGNMQSRKIGNLTSGIFAISKDLSGIFVIFP